MVTEERTVHFDRDLQMEAYTLRGVAQPFPNHFHDYYVVGLIRAGERYLLSKNREYLLRPGDVVLFNPGDSHACAQAGGVSLTYLGLNIMPPVMEAFSQEGTGRREPPRFGPTVVAGDGELASCVQALHESLIGGASRFEKEELCLQTMGLLLNRYGEPCWDPAPDCRSEIEAVCAYLDEHFAQPITLDRLCALAGMSKSALIRGFAASRGVTPYRYLQSVRVGAAKKWLEAGCSPMEAAMRTGFSDQSHFTRFFSLFIGLTPGAYRDIFRGGSPPVPPPESATVTTAGPPYPAETEETNDEP